MGAAEERNGGAGGGELVRGAKAFGAELGLKEGRVRQLCQRGMPHTKAKGGNLFGDASREWYRMNAGAGARRHGKGGERPGAGRPKKNAAEGEGSDAQRATLKGTDGRDVTVAVADAEKILGQGVTLESLRKLPLDQVERIDRVSRAFKAYLEAELADGRVVLVDEAKRVWGAAGVGVKRGLTYAARLASDRLVAEGLIDPAQRARAQGLIEREHDEALERMSTDLFGGPEDASDAG